MPPASFSARRPTQHRCNQDASESRLLVGRGWGSWHNRGLIRGCVSCQLSAAPAPESRAGDAACSGTPPRAVPAQWPCSGACLVLHRSAAFTTVHTPRGETRSVFGSSLAFISGVAGAGAGTPPLSPLLADTPPRSLECWPRGHRKPSPFLLSAHSPPSVFLEKSPGSNLQPRAPQTLCPGPNP